MVLLGQKDNKILDYLDQNMYKSRRSSSYAVHFTYTKANTVQATNLW